jgi:Fe-S oxidoreductase/nitrate reductase gamma subunit
MENLHEATRPIVDYGNWQIPVAWMMYVLFVIALIVFGVGVKKRISMWKQGKPDKARVGDLGKRFVFMVKELLLQKRVRNMSFPAVFHSSIFYGFVVFVITTAVVAMDYDFGTTFFRGWLYVALTVGCEIFGLFVMIAVAAFLVRRKAKLDKNLPHWAGDTWALVFVFLIVVTGFIIEGIRLAILPDPWEALSFVGLAFSLPFRGMEPELGATLHKSLWWLHTAMAMFWIAAIPYTKFVHILFLPANAFLAKMNPRGELARENVLEMMESDLSEDELKLGVQKTEEFTWKQLLDLDACIRCGRCEAMCPSLQAGEPFGPRQFLANCLELHMKNSREAAAAKAAGKEFEPKDIVEGAFDEKFLWFCRTCGACMDICPAFIDHVDDMMTVKRNEIMIQGRVPSEGQRVLRTMETGGNPFALQSDRSAFIEDDLKARVIKKGQKVDVLYYIGCLSTFDLEKQKIARHVGRLLDMAGIDWGVMGEGEICCGDPARVLGQEMQFQMSAQAQVEELNARQFDILMTACPHCLNTLKNEYPQFGGKYKVMHHSEYLLSLVEQGKLSPKVASGSKVVFHDPCYLGRYQDQFEAPRQVLGSIPGLKRKEMRSHHAKSLCCGGGGGHFFMDLKGGDKRVNNMRVEQAKEAGAEVIATACGFCMGMLDDAVKTLNLEESMKVKDIATLMLESVGGQLGKNAPTGPAQDSNN